MNLQINITTPLKRLRKAKPLPAVESSEAEAKSFFAGWWHGIGVGIVIGLSTAVLVIGAMR